jgi:hypothetical protein
MKPYEKTGTTGVTGRAASRGFERFSFLPSILLLVGVLGGIFGWTFFKNWNPRDASDFDAQFVAMEAEVRERAARSGFEADVPPESSWQRRSFGDVDEWRGLILLDQGEGFRPLEVVITFNQTTHGLIPRWESGRF